MKRTTNFYVSHILHMDVLNHVELNRVKGGTGEADEVYEIIYIDGVPYLVRRNGQGQIIEIMPA